MKIYKYQGFDDHLLKLSRRGGSFSKAAQTVYALLGKASSKNDPFKGLKTTNHGESRIPKCIKYDLSAAVRLVTVRHKGVPILLFVGDHEDCDKWLEQNKGRVFTINEANQIESTVVEATGVEVGPGESPLSAPGPLLDRLDAATVDRLLQGLSRTNVHALDTLTAASTNADIEAATSSISDPDQSTAVRDILLLLLSGSIREAIVRASLYLEDVQELQELDDIEVPAIVDSEFVKAIGPAHPQYGEIIKQYARSSDYKSWMTFLHPDQEQIVDQSFAGPSKLLGVSGSGKTCVVVKRAVALAQRYAKSRILVLTLNEPLAKLVDTLIDVCTLPDERQRIEVMAFYETCRSLLIELEPDKERHYRRVTWKGEEHIDEIWLEFYQCENNNRDAEVLQGAHDALISQGFRADRYLRDEMDWIRSACPPTARDRYVKAKREGRVVPLGEDLRASILAGLDGWERKMAFVGSSDVLDVASAVHRHIDRIKPRYRCILVDESQDFGNIELEIIRALARKGKDDLFLCGDAAQQVSSRYQNLHEAGIDVPPARSKKLIRNYRNSRDILRAAHEVLTNNITEEMLDREDFEVMDPEYSVFEGTLPVLLSDRDHPTELKRALSYAAQYVKENVGTKACIALAGYSLYEIENWASPLGLPVLNGQTGLDYGSIFVSDLEQAKGFEFDMVCIANCRRDQLPKKGEPASESFRDLSRLYVAMTRAKFDLILSYSGEPSVFFEDLGEYVGIGEWGDYVERIAKEFTRVRAPAPVEEIRQDGLCTMSVGEMSGEQFLYTAEAVGLEPDLIAKIRELVDGRGIPPKKRARKSEGTSQAKRKRQTKAKKDSKKWATMASAARDYKKTRASRQPWGDVGPKFSELAERLGL
jgi:hypothetical protein